MGHDNLYSHVLSLGIRHEHFQWWSWPGSSCPWLVDPWRRGCRTASCPVERADPQRSSPAIYACALDWDSPIAFWQLAPVSRSRLVRAGLSCCSIRAFANLIKKLLRVMFTLWLNLANFSWQSQPCHSRWFSCFLEGAIGSDGLPLRLQGLSGSPSSGWSPSNKSFFSTLQYFHNEHNLVGLVCLTSNWH